MLLIRYWKPLAAIVLVLGWSAGMYAWGYNTRGVACEAAQLADEAQDARTLAEAHRAAREAERATVDAVAKATDEADKRNDKIEQDYQRRIAGVVDERDRLRDLWRGHQATDRLADDSEAARAHHEQDRLRRESAARIVRAVERVQSERDEVIDRYEAVRKAINP